MSDIFKLRERTKKAKEANDYCELYAIECDIRSEIETLKSIAKEAREHRIEVNRLRNIQFLQQQGLRKGRNK